MTASSHLSIAETQALLVRLRNLMRDFAGREAALDKDLRFRSEQARRDREQALEQLDAEATAAREAALASWRDAEAELTATLEHCQAIIARARAAAGIRECAATLDKCRQDAGTHRLEHDLLRAGRDDDPHVRMNPVTF